MLEQSKRDVPFSLFLRFLTIKRSRKKKPTALGKFVLNPKMLTIFRLKVKAEYSCQNETAVGSNCA